MFRFTIRDVLWLTVVVALAVGWFVEHRATERRFAAQEAKLAAQGAAHKREMAALNTALKSGLNSVRNEVRRIKR